MQVAEQTEEVKEGSNSKKIPPKPLGGHFLVNTNVRFEFIIAFMILLYHAKLFLSIPFSDCLRLKITAAPLNFKHKFQRFHSKAKALFETVVQA